MRVVPRELPLLPPKTNPEAVNTVYQAFLDGRRFTARYRARRAKGDEPKEYEVNPLGIVARGSLVYQVCTFWDYTDIRQLALHRIRVIWPRLPIGYSWRLAVNAIAALEGACE